MDVWGLAHSLSSRGNIYYVSILDDYSKYLWLFPLSTKSVVTSHTSAFINFVQNFFSTKIKAIQTDGGTEFKPLIPLFFTLGISHRITCPYSHQQNGSIENRHKHIINTGLALLAHSSVPLSYWDYAFETAVYSINHHPTPLLQNLSPFDLLMKKPPDYNFL